MPGIGRRTGSFGVVGQCAVEALADRFLEFALADSGAVAMCAAFKEQQPRLRRVLALQKHVDRAGIDDQRLGHRRFGGENAQIVGHLDHRPFDKQAVDARRLFERLA